MAKIPFSQIPLNPAYRKLLHRCAHSFEAVANYAIASIGCLRSLERNLSFRKIHRQRSHVDSGKNEWSEWRCMSVCNGAFPAKKLAGLNIGFEGSYQRTFSHGPCSARTGAGPSSLILAIDRWVADRSWVPTSSRVISFTCAFSMGK